MDEIEFRELNLFIAVAETGQFTEAASRLGISQSALTRQIQALESKLGRPLFSRTTRSIRLTKEGEFWLEKAHAITQQARQSTAEFANLFLDQTPKVKIGVCQTISLAYLPGFFHQFRKRYPEIQIRFRQGAETDLMNDLDSCELDVVIVCRPKSMIQGLEVSHQFTDEYVLIAPSGVGVESFDQLDLIEIDRSTATGAAIGRWKKKYNILAEPTMEFNNYDLIIKSVSLGLGNALVPHRALAIYNKDKKIERHRLENRLSRELCVLSRAELNRPSMIQSFIDNILF